ncbi:hypothetical protein [Flavobacterium sp.]|jgi:hypothetical protein|uniref:hypothetical protein n=1 Tax=Flavobacterium sp. TaxID=239 RepID=UPI0037C0FD09
MKTIIFSLVLFFTLSCTNNNDKNDFEPQTITPVLIGNGHLGTNNTFYTKQNIVITTNREWQALLTNFNSIRNNITATFTETNVDFDKYQIIVVIDDGNSATTIDIANITENNNNIAVSINRKLGIAQDVVNLFHIVKIPKSSKPIEFQQIK